MNNESVLEFIEQFNKIESHLEEMVGVSHSMSFSKVLHLAAKQDYVIRREQKLLDDLRELRNVLVHEAGNKVIAYPSEEALSEIRRISGYFDRDTTVWSIIHHKIIYLKLTDDLTKALRVMKEHDHTRIPIYDNGCCVGLLSSRAIVRWMALQMEAAPDMLACCDRVTIKDVMVHSDEKDHVKYISKDMTVRQLLTMMADKPSGSGKYLMTEHGDPKEKPLTIITEGDYVVLEKMLME